ncbi:hypothetical protein BRD04_01285 [Halobacteriales archaeon QS_9_67_17]|nr:MAG: hypothetical protein BRD04_01285 [Halobacteriales archaeon QS_9_67_17]
MRTGIRRRYTSHAVVDFGIVPVEALASGTPVIGVRDGYTQHQIDDGETGLLYDRGPDNLRDALDRFETDGVALSADDIAATAEKYGVEAFREGMRAAVEDALDSVRIDSGVERTDG